MERGSTVFLSNKMLSVLLFSVIIAQSSASFFNDFASALSAVESKVVKLAKDVGADLRETYDCTVGAVEEIIYDKDQISKYYDKCKVTSTNSSADTGAVAKGTPQTISIYVKPIVSGSSKDETTIKSNDTVLYRNPKDIDKKLDSVERIINNEYNRVDNMSSHLEHEFDGLSKNLDDKLKVIEKEKYELQKTLLEIKNIHLEEEMQIERTKEEIRNIFDELLKKINKSTKESDLKSEMNAAVSHIDKNTSKTILVEIEKWKEKGMDQWKVLQKADANTTNKRDLTESNMPRTFKELAAKISNDASATNNPNKEFSTSSHNVSSTETVPASLTSTVSPIKLVSRALSPTTVSSETLIQASTAATPISTIAVTFAPNVSTTISSIESVTQSLKVATTISTQSFQAASLLLEPVARPSTVATTSTESVTRPSTVATTSTEAVTRPSTVATTSTEAVTQPSTVATTSTEAVTRPSTVATTSTESVTRPSTVATTSTEAVTQLSTVATTSTEAVTRPSTVATTSTEAVTPPPTIATTSTETVTPPPTIATTSTEAVTRPSTVATTSTEAVTRSSTVATTSTEAITRPSTAATTSTEAVTQPSIAATTSTEAVSQPSTVAPYVINTRPVVTSTEPISWPKYTRNKKRGKNSRKKNKSRYTNRKIITSTPTPSNNGHLPPKNTIAAVAEALKIFSNSIKTKPALDKFFKNIDKVPKSQIF